MKSTGVSLICNLMSLILGLKQVYSLQLVLGHVHEVPLLGVIHSAINHGDGLIDFSVWHMKFHPAVVPINTHTS